MLILSKEKALVLFIICFLQVNCEFSTFELQDYFTCEHHVTTKESKKLADNFNNTLETVYLKYRDSPSYEMCRRNIKNVFYTFRTTIQFTGGKCTRNSADQKSGWFDRFKTFVTDAFKGTTECYRLISPYMMDWLQHYITNDMFHCSKHNSKQEVLYQKYIYTIEESNIKPADYFTCVFHLDTSSSKNIENYFTEHVEMVYNTYNEGGRCQKSVGALLLDFHDKYYENTLKNVCKRRDESVAFFNQSSLCHEGVSDYLKGKWLTTDLPQMFHDCLINS